MASVIQQKRDENCQILTLDAVPQADSKLVLSTSHGDAPSGVAASWENNGCPNQRIGHGPFSGTVITLSAGRSLSTFAHASCVEIG